jgi:hypothetical protein
MRRALPANMTDDLPTIDLSTLELVTGGAAPNEPLPTCPPPPRDSEHPTFAPGAPY